MVMESGKMKDDGSEIGEAFGEFPRAGCRGSTSDKARLGNGEVDQRWRSLDH